MLKYVPLLSACSRFPGFSAPPSPTRASLGVTAGRWRPGGRIVAVTEILLLISGRNQLVLFPALFLLTQRQWRGGIFGPVARGMEFEFCSLCHYYTPPTPFSPCFLPLRAHSHGDNLCMHTHTHTRDPPFPIMHLSPVVLWHWTVC